MFGSTHNNSESSPSSEIVDSGFIITSPLHNLLKERPVLNDYCAAINSMLLCVACLWPLKVTFYEGDYSLAFRLLATQVFRSFCGWFTYLPVPHQFLPSLYDFPEAIYCVTRAVDCEDPHTSTSHLPFLTFFSGHVACTVIIANHLYLRNHKTLAVLLHVLNVLQILRLLATRGHYSIDIIVGWAVAVYVSNPAERVGKYYSKYRYKEFRKKSISPQRAFEAISGVRDVKLGTEYNSKDADEPSTSPGHSFKLANDYLVSLGMEKANSFEVPPRVKALKDAYKEARNELLTMKNEELVQMLDVYRHVARVKAQGRSSWSSWRSKGGAAAAACNNNNNNNNNSNSNEEGSAVVGGRAKKDE